MEELARRANVQMQSQHRSTLQYKDVGKILCLACLGIASDADDSSTQYIVFHAATVVHDWKALLFLSGNCGLVVCCC